MVFLQYQPWTRLLIALLYNAGLCILSLHSVIDIIVLSYFSFELFSNIMGLLIIVASVGSTFYGLSLDLSSHPSVFVFIEGVLSMNHLVNSFAPFLDLSIYALLVMATYFVCKA